MAILAILDDLVFRTKLEAAAAPLGVSLRVATDVDSALRALADAPDGRVIVDLHLSGSDPIAIVRAIRQAHPTASIVGYCSHVDVARQEQARHAGCLEVLPRSAFVRRLPDLLRDAAGASP